MGALARLRFCATEAKWSLDACALNDNFITNRNFSCSRVSDFADISLNVTPDDEVETDVHIPVLLFLRFHSLGASHDGTEGSKWIPGNPGALSCPSSDYNIMSPITNKQNTHRFSNCSVAQIYAFVKWVRYRSSRTFSCYLIDEIVIILLYIEALCNVNSSCPTHFSEMKNWYNHASTNEQ